MELTNFANNLNTLTPQIKKMIDIYNPSLGQIYIKLCVPTIANYPNKYVEHILLSTSNLNDLTNLQKQLNESVSVNRPFNNLAISSNCYEDFVSIVKSYYILYTVANKYLYLSVNDFSLSLQTILSTSHVESNCRAQQASQLSYFYVVKDPLHAPVERQIKVAVNTLIYKCVCHKNCSNERECSIMCPRKCNCRHIVFPNFQHAPLFIQNGYGKIIKFNQICTYSKYSTIAPAYLYNHAFIDDELNVDYAAYLSIYCYPNHNSKFYFTLIKNVLKIREGFVENWCPLVSGVMDYLPTVNEVEYSPMSITSIVSDLSSIKEVVGNKKINVAFTF